MVCDELCVDVWERDCVVETDGDDETVALALPDPDGVAVTLDVADTDAVGV